MGILANKKALIIGAASNRSIAYGIAEAMTAQGAEIALSYQNERLAERVTKLATKLNSKIVLQCDVSKDDDIANMFNNIKEIWGSFDILVHSVAYAPSDQLQGSFVEAVTREGFHTAHDISSYSLAALAKAAMPLLNQGSAAIMTVSYLGANRVFPSYNTMGIAKASLEATVKYLASSMGPAGIRVNAVSAGPIKTLAAAGITDFKKMLEFNKTATPLRSNVTTAQVGNASAFLCSDLASGITGEIMHVDNGFNIVGMAIPNNEEAS